MPHVIPVTFSMPAALIERLDRVAAADDRSRSSVVRQVLSAALADDAALRENAAARFRSLMSPGGQAPAADPPSAPDTPPKS